MSESWLAPISTMITSLFNRNKTKAETGKTDIEAIALLQDVQRKEAEKWIPQINYYRERLQRARIEIRGLEEENEELRTDMRRRR